MDWMSAVTSFLSGDLDGVVTHRYSPEMCAHCPPDPSDKPLPRATPESMGVSSQAISAIYRELNQALELEPHGLMVMRHGHVITESHWSPYRNSTPQILYSLSKSLVSTAVGLAVSQGLLELDENAAMILPESMPSERDLKDRRMLDITVRHLLTMTSGTTFNEALTMFSENWGKDFFSHSLMFDPGAFFKYNSMNTYLLSAILMRRTGMGLLEYLTKHVFSKIGISDAHWEMCPQGIEKGGWGLALSPENLCRLGQLYLQGGWWGEGTDRVSVLPEAWIKEASTIKVHTDKDESDPGYGYQIWMCHRPGAYMFCGMFGQYVFVVPDLDMVIAMTSANGQGSADHPVENILWRNLESEGAVIPTGSLPENSVDLTFLRKLEEDNRLFAGGSSARPLKESRFHNRVYKLDRNHAGLLPGILQAVYANFTHGNDTIGFDFDPAFPGECRMVITEGNDVNTVRLGLDGTPRYGTVSIGGQVLQTGSVARWTCDALDNPVLTAHITFIETPDTRIIRCTFRPDDIIRLEFSETPSVANALEQVNQLIGTMDFANRRLLIYALRRHGTQIRDAASNLSTPVVEGSLSLP